MKKKPDKYALYREAVQSTDSDVRFLRKIYRQLRNDRLPRVLGEDFCGTFGLCCDWVKLDPKHSAVGVDLDPQPLAYGHKNYESRLKPEQKARVQILNKNVLSVGLPKADIVAALNFSFYLFQGREDLRNYFKRVRSRLRPGGVFVIDAFGGSACAEPNVDRLRKRGFVYFWEQESFDPVSNRAKFAIHFKVPGHPKMKRAFTYDWRMWSLPELREILAEAGFRRSHVYWEGTNKRGGGNGIFRRATKGEACQSWIAYVAAEL